MPVIKASSPTTFRPSDGANPFDAAVQRIVRNVCGTASADTLDDCLQEARLCLWLARERLAAMEEPTRTYIAGACIRNAAGRYIRLESRFQSLLFPTDLLSGDNYRATQDRPGYAAALSSGDWLDQLEMPELARAVASLPSIDRKILHLYYGYGMTDREISIETSATIGSVIKRRSRAIRRLRSANQAQTA